MRNRLLLKGRRKCIVLLLQGNAEAVFGEAFELLIDDRKVTRNEKKRDKKGTNSVRRGKKDLAENLQEKGARKENSQIHHRNKLNREKGSCAFVGYAGLKRHGKGIRLELLLSQRPERSNALRKERKGWVLSPTTVGRCFHRFLPIF